MGGLEGAVCFRPGEVRRGRAERVVCASACYGPVTRARLPALAPRSQSRDLESRGPGPGCRKGAATLPPVSIQHRAMRCGTPPRAPPLCPRAAARCG